MFWLQPLQYLKMNKILSIKTKVFTIVNNRSPNFNITLYYVILRQSCFTAINLVQQSRAIAFLKDDLSLY